MIATKTTVLPATKLKIKLSCKTVMSYDFGKGLSSVVAQSSLPVGKKRGPPVDIEAPRGKKPKTRERKMKSHCSTKLSGKQQPPSLIGSKCGNNSERSLGKEQNHHLSSANVTGSDCQAKKADGAVRVVDEENVCPNYGEEWSTSIFNVPLSPKKALRVAMLKSRYADLLLKSQVILGQGNTSDQLKMQQEKARLEHKQREEKAKIEAELRAAEAAVQRQAELELKEQREREREARIALEKMERTVVFEQHCYVDELSKLAGYNGDTFWGSHFRSPLARLGLSIKDDTVEDDELKERHEREREEARIALEKMKRSVVFEEHCYIEELSKLAGYNGDSFWGLHFRSPLEKFGFYIRDECTVEDAELEEGEIEDDVLEEGEIEDDVLEEGEIL